MHQLVITAHTSDFSAAVSAYFNWTALFLNKRVQVDHNVKPLSYVEVCSIHFIFQCGSKSPNKGHMACRRVCYGGRGHALSRPSIL